MAIVYKGPFIEDPDSQRQGYSLFELLTSEHEFMINGVRIMRKGSSEWDEDIAEFRRRLGRTTSPEEMERIMERESSRDVRVGNTPFHAMHYRGHRLLYDQDGGVIGEASIARKQIDFFHLAMCPVDMAKKAGTTRSYLYDGSMRDAIEEFEHEGYSFNLLDVGWNAYRIEDRERTQSIAHVTPIERASIDDVIKFGSQRQR